MDVTAENLLIVVIWKMRDMDGDAGWHIAEFSTHAAASNRAGRLRARSDVKHIKMIDVQ